MSAPNQSLAQAIKKRIAVVAVGPSTARGQGAPGVVGAARAALEFVRLERFSTRDQRAFDRALDAETRRVMASLPAKARSWGLARKCLNMFLRDCFYSHDLRRAFKLGVAERRFEVPLDAVVARGLRKHGRDRRAPRWPGVKRLTPELSAEYQAIAADLSRRMRISRVHLDTFLWIEGR